jgi:hypothetical protein
MANYRIDEFGVVCQIDPQPIKYDVDYVVSRYQDKPLDLSYLRFGFMCGSLGCVPSSVLDIGYGCGDFLKVCVKSGMDCFGYDVTNFPLPQPLQVVRDPFIRVDVVTMFDSLEHHVSMDFLRDLWCDYLVVSVPWCHQSSGVWFEEWKHRRPDEHLFHFGLDSLVEMMECFDFMLLSYSNVGDTVRGELNGLPNILTACFEKV